jgi:eukaryotic-like serine/threonine-protein kinase
MDPATDELDDAALQGRFNARDKRLGLIVAGSYRTTRHIGSGGSSHVFEATHVRLGKRFAVKLLRAELDTGKRAAQRFRREAQAVARLNSEHIVSVVDCGELDDATPYLVMELLDGEDLRGLLTREGFLPARRAVEIVRQACRGLTVVHAAGLVHRDLKPENLFIARRSTGEDWCKVLDFGVAKMHSSLSTAQGAIVGTVRYMAPEQLANSTSVAATTDVYALGAILYECLTGKPVAAGTSVQEVMYHIMNLEPVALHVLAPTLPEALTRVVDLCLAKSPHERPESAAKLATLLKDSVARSEQLFDAETIAEDSTTAARETAQPCSGTRRHGVRLAATTAVGVLCGVALGWSLRDSGAGYSPQFGGSSPPATARTAQLTVVENPPRATEAAGGGGGSTSPSSSSAAREGARKERARAVRPPTPGLVLSATRNPVLERFDSVNPYAE